jgi:hypothetical protein
MTGRQEIELERLIADVPVSDPNGRLESSDERLGPAGAMRFMMQYDPGYGDYTQECQDIFAELTIDTLLDAIDERAHSEDRH